MFGSLFVLCFKTKFYPKNIVIFLTARLNKGGEKGFVALTLATLLPLQPFEFETVSTIKEINYFRSAH